MKNKIFVLVIVLTVSLVLADCSPQQVQQSPTAVVQTESTNTATEPGTVAQHCTTTSSPTLGLSRTPTISCTTTMTPQPTTPVQTTTREPPPFLLAAPDPQSFGKRIFTFKDANRAGCEVETAIWYPAPLAADQAGKVVEDAPQTQAVHRTPCSCLPPKPVGDSPLTWSFMDSSILASET